MLVLEGPTLAVAPREGIPRPAGAACHAQVGKRPELHCLSVVGSKKEPSRTEVGKGSVRQQATAHAFEGVPQSSWWGQGHPAFEGTRAAPLALVIHKAVEHRLCADGPCRQLQLSAAARIQLLGQLSHPGQTARRLAIGAT